MMKFMKKGNGHGGVQIKVFFFKPPILFVFIMQIRTHIPVCVYVYIYIKFLDTDKGHLR